MDLDLAQFAFLHNLVFVILLLLEQGVHLHAALPAYWIMGWVLFWIYYKELKARRSLETTSSGKRV